MRLPRGLIAHANKISVTWRPATRIGPRLTEQAGGRCDHTLPRSRISESRGFADGQLLANCVEVSAANPSRYQHLWARFAIFQSDLIGVRPVAATSGLASPALPTVIATTVRTASSRGYIHDRPYSSCCRTFAGGTTHVPNVAAGSAAEPRNVQQQNAATAPTTFYLSPPTKASDLHQRPLPTSMQLVHTEEVTGSIPVSPTDVRPAQRLH